MAYGRKIQRVAVAVVCAPVMVWSFVGCSSGQGKYTSAFKEQAELRMAQVKAGTDWDMAQQQYRSGDLKKALKNVERSIAQNDQVPKSHMLRGKVLLEMNRLESAMDAFDSVLGLDGTLSEAQYYRGIIFERYSRSQQAFEAYSLAAQGEQDNPQYALACAESLISLGALDDAESMLTSRAGAFEHNAGIKQTLAHIAQVRGDADAAVKLFNDAYLLAPDDNSLLEDLARSQARAGMFGEADQNLARLLAMHEMEGRRDLERLRVKCLVQLDQPVEARSILRRHVQEDGGSADVHSWIELGNIAMLLGDNHELRWAAGRVVAMAPERHEGFLLMGAYQHRVGEIDKAVRSLERSARLTESDPSASILLHLVYAELGQLENARRALRQAEALAPDDIRVAQLHSSFESLAGVTVD